MYNELISIIVCIYNMEKYLDNCVISIVNQTYQNIEIILVDDGSKDLSPAICNKWMLEDSRIKVIYQTNQGISGARNTGILNSTGKYISFVDADDFVDIYYIEVLYEKMKTNEVDMVICDFVNYYKKNELDDIMNKKKNMGGKLLSQKEVILMTNDSKCDRIIVSWNKLYKRECFRNITYPIGKVYEDSFVIHYILENIRTVYFDYGVYYYRYLRNDSIMHEKFTVRNLQVLEPLLDRCNFYEHKLSSTEYISFMGRYLDNLIIYYLKVLINIQDSDHILANLKNDFITFYRRYYRYKTYFSFKKQVKYFLFRYFTIWYAMLMKKEMR